MTPGLWVFIAVLILDAVVLFIDLPIWLQGGYTVSKLAKDHPTVIALIVGLQLIGTLGLTLHLLNKD